MNNFVDQIRFSEEGKKENQKKQTDLQPSKVGRKNGEQIGFLKPYKLGKIDLVVFTKKTKGNEIRSKEKVKETCDGLFGIKACALVGGKRRMRSTFIFNLLLINYIFN